MLAINVKLVHLSCLTVTAWRNLLNNKKIMTSHSHSYPHYIVFFSSLRCFIMQMESCGCTLQHPASYKERGGKTEQVNSNATFQAAPQLSANTQTVSRLLRGYKNIFSLWMFYSNMIFAAADISQISFRSMFPSLLMFLVLLKHSYIRGPAPLNRFVQQL